MYIYYCPYCGRKNVSPLISSTESRKYRRDLCKQARCHLDWRCRYFVITGEEICAVCSNRVECIAVPIVKAEVFKGGWRLRDKRRNVERRKTIRRGFEVHGVD